MENLLRLLNYDGPLSQMNFTSVQLAREKKITLLKLQPHTTDVFQPLDESVLKFLKDHWELVLF